MRINKSGYPLFQGGEAVKEGATWQVIVWEHIKQRVGYLLNSLGVPGFVKPTKVYDRLTNSHLEVRLGGFFTVVSVDGKDYYFRRLTGEYDGSGMAVSCDKD